MLINPYVLSKLWTPAQITTSLWLDAADSSTITTVSGAVSQWNDKSGNNRHATQSTASQRPTLIAADRLGRDVVSFDGSNDFLATTAGSYAAVEYYLVAIFTGSATVNNPYFSARTSPNANKVAASDINCGFGYSGSASSTWCNFAGNATLAQVNGANVSSLTNFNSFTTGITPASSWFLFNQTISATGTGSKQFAIGADAFASVGSRHIQAKIGEFIIASSAQSQSNREKIQGYLAHKWGLAANLPADHPYKLSPPII